jgi:3-demethoxyubiquinol 3-hydroxylase
LFVYNEQNAIYRRIYMRNPGLTDKWLGAANAALTILAAQPRASRPSPALKIVQADDDLNEADKKLSGALMRVNHVGEVCAQALYQSQSMLTNDENVRAHLLHAAAEELDHLAWTRERLAQLGARPSLLNPLWFAGSFAMGLLVGRLNPQMNLGFVVETERQVEAHLARHLERLPVNDAPSRAIVEQMQQEEGAHAAAALKDGASVLPEPARRAMQVTARVMTSTAHYI